ncbi:hypothetical protein CY34DRAFT_717455 [Suillus luteus UH-Slu-Lm8-n1]|uniref:Uncharacterized protein n=1 Tax=Suillus luteus UH-Slu-Lm8-n1 TaxID=930992 RepID=A0A0D0ANB9_9AGAM|nr:hypothetical protein CY34DRAFT_717455 [Suillus luteus UH-Slu-Lm8-n1]
MGLLLCAENFYLKFILGGCAPKQPRISAMSTDCQSRPISNLERNYHLASVSRFFSVCFWKKMVFSCIHCRLCSHREPTEPNKKWFHDGALTNSTNH